MAQHLNTDVIVAGSGPTGLMLATELALAGVRPLVIDRLPERSGQSKALNLQPRTAEVFELRDLLSTARERSLGDIPDGHFAAIPLEFERLDTRHRYQVGIPQARIEEVLEERLAEFGHTVRRGHRLTACTQDGEGVTATVEGPDGEILAIRARYLVGCDGGRSTVRKLAGIPFTGSEAQKWAVVADVVLGAMPDGTPKGWRSMKDVLPKNTHKESYGSVIPLAEPGLNRMVYFGPDAAGPEDKRREPVPAEDVARMVRSIYGETSEVVEVRWASRFGDAARQAERYRDGRILLAGDAAHVHWPAGGQGLNLGVQDAFNLGWKLAATVRGDAPEELLDTYHAERHPVGAAVLANTRAQSALARRDEQAGALRALLIELVKLPEVNDRLAGMVSGLGIRYPVDGPEHPLLGARLPDVELAGAKLGGTEVARTSALLHPGRAVLLTADAEAAEAVRPWAGRVDSVRVDRMPELPGGAGALLVRPDGYVCWVAGDGEDAGQAVKRLDGALREWFGAPDGSA